MEAKSPLEKTLVEILTKREFNRLAPYSHSNVWGVMSPLEREMLAVAHLAHGTELLQIEGDQKKSEDARVEDARVEDAAFHAFELSEEIASDLPHVLYQQVVCLTKVSTNQRCLLRALKILERITQLKEDYYDAWYTWGNVLLTMGILSKDASFLYEAETRFEMAYPLRITSKQTLQKEFFWHWGLTFQLIAKQSGEASDYYKAISKFKLAQEEGLVESRYWNSYANALFDLSLLVTREDLAQTAVQFYKQALSLKPDFPECWFNLACCYQHLFFDTLEEEFYNLADGSFEEAFNQDKTNVHLFCKWGMLDAYAGKLTRNIQLLTKSIDKFKRADELEPSYPPVLSSWAEALMLVGSQTENIELLKSAEEKMSLCLKIAPEVSHHWYLMGTILNEMGRYFADADIYKRAIEKFHYGISLNRTDHLLWYGLSLAHFAIGDMEQDPEMIEKTVRYCSRVIEFGGEMMPHFWNDWGVALMKLGIMKGEKKHLLFAIEKFEEAIKRHNECTSDGSMDAEWLYNYGCALDFLGDYSEDEKYYEKAVQVLSQTIALDPSYAHARYNLAIALMHLGESTGEVDCFFKANDLFQAITQEESEDDMAWNDWGLSLLHLGDLLQDPAQMEMSEKLFSLAETKFNHAIQLGNSQSFYHLACIFSLKGNYIEAMNYLDKAEAIKALPSIKELMTDEWLEGVRTTSDFNYFIEDLKSKQKKNTEN